LAWLGSFPPLVDMLGSWGRGLRRQYPSPPRPIAMSNVDLDIMALTIIWREKKVLYNDNDKLVVGLK